MKVSKGLKQAYELQDFCHEAAIALRQSLTKDGKLTITRDDSQAIKALVSSWRDCQERVSFHRRTPSPGSLKPESKANHRGRRSWASASVVELDATEVPQQPPAQLAPLQSPPAEPQSGAS